MKRGVIIDVRMVPGRERTVMVGPADLMPPGQPVPREYRRLTFPDMWFWSVWQPYNQLTYARTMVAWTPPAAQRPIYCPGVCLGSVASLDIRVGRLDPVDAFWNTVDNEDRWRCYQLGQPNKHAYSARYSVSIVMGGAWTLKEYLKAFHDQPQIEYRGDHE